MLDFSRTTVGAMRRKHGVSNHKYVQCVKVNDISKGSILIMGQFLGTLEDGFHVLGSVWEAGDYDWSDTREPQWRGSGERYVVCGNGRWWLEQAPGYDVEEFPPQWLRRI